MTLHRCVSFRLSVAVAVSTMVCLACAAAQPALKPDVVAQHPEVVQELDAAYDRWWNSVQPQLVNENAVGPKVNPFTACIARLRGETGAGPS
jgi:hypothetical protein